MKKRFLLLFLVLWLASCAAGPSFRYEECSSSNPMQLTKLHDTLNALIAANPYAGKSGTHCYICVLDDNEKVLVWLQMSNIKGRVSPIFCATSAAIDQAPSDDHLMFCVAHELAHLSLGHLDDAAVLRSTAAKREIEADREAVRLIGKAGVKDPARVSTETLEWIKRIWKIGEGSGPSKNHPAINDRIKSLQSAFQ